MIRHHVWNIFVLLCLYFATNGPGSTQANVISPFKLKQWSILKDKQAEKADQNLVFKEKQLIFSKSKHLISGRESWKRNDLAQSKKNDVAHAQSTLSKDDRRLKELRVLATDLTDAEGKLFVGHIPDIEDVGVFHPIPVPSNFEAYDVNPPNGEITLFELMEVTKAEENIGDSFFAADKDKDGIISRSEFLDAPWWLEVDNRDTTSNAMNSQNHVDVIGSSLNDVEAVEDQLPLDEHRSWHYILNGNLQQQQQQQQQPEIGGIGRQLSIDLGDVFTAADKVLLSDEEMERLKKELNLR